MPRKKQSNNSNSEDLPDNPKNKLEDIKKASVKTRPMIFRRKTDLPWNSVCLVAFNAVDQFNGADDEDDCSFFRRKTDIEKCKKLDDSALIEVIHGQNRELYWELFNRYQHKLFVYILHLVGNKEEAEDIMQNVFTKTYKNIKHFDLSRKFSSWIYRIAHNEAVNYLKRKNKKYFVSWEDVSASKDKLEMTSNEVPIEDIWFQQEITKEIREAMEKLPPKYKEILMMRYFSEYSYEKIGGVLNKPVNTVGTLINRAKKKLLEVVNENDKENGISERF